MKTNARTAATTLIAALCCALAPARALAQTAPAVRFDEELTATRTLALGGRAEATSTSTASMFGNPAAITGLRAYHTDAFVLYDPTVNRWAFGSVIVDSTRQYVSAGLAYVYSTMDNPQDMHREVHDTRINISVALGQAISLGVMGRYLNASSSPPTMQGSILTSGSYSGFTLDAGVFVHPWQWLSVSATGHNLNDQRNTIAPIGAGFGVAASPASMLTFVVDAQIDFRMTGSVKGRYSAGAELFLGNHFPIRVGYMYDDVRHGAQSVTAGIGYIDQTIGVELSMREGIVPDYQTTLMLSLRYFYGAAAQ